MSEKEAAGTILNKRLPFLPVLGAVGSLEGKLDLTLALLESASRNELVTNTAKLEKVGVFNNPVLKAAYDHAISRTSGDKKTNILKATRASSTIKDETVAAKLERVQEEQLDTAAKLTGDWLILADCSGSMETSIEVSRHVASFVAKQTEGKVYLVFFNEAPYSFDITGLTYNEILQKTKRATASGQTSIGCGLDLLLQNNTIINGIIIVSDGGENAKPYFPLVYEKYCTTMGIEPTIYLFHVPGQGNILTAGCDQLNIQITTFELGSRPDYTALPEIINKLRSNRYSLVSEIMNSKLLTFKDLERKQLHEELRSVRC